MKRTVFFLMLALLCATSHAQINPKMQQLFDKLTEMGEAPRIVKHGGKYQPTVLEYGVHLYYSPNMYRDSHTPFIDSLLREDKNNLEQGLAAIRHTLDDLQAEAAESYHYEYHKGVLKSKETHNMQEKKLTGYPSVDKPNIHNLRRQTISHLAQARYFTYSISNNNHKNRARKRVLC